MNNQNQYLASNLTYLMKMSGLPTKQLAQIFNISVEQLSNLKSGRFTNPTVKYLISISNYFNVTIDHLLYTNIAKLGTLPKLNNYIPLFSFENLTHPNSDLILITHDLPPDTFAIKISNKLSAFQNGSILFVNRHIKPKSLDYIVVLNLTTWLYSLKQLIIEDSTYLKSTIMDKNTKLFNKTEYAHYATVIGYQITKFF